MGQRAAGASAGGLRLGARRLPWLCQAGLRLRYKRWGHDQGTPLGGRTQHSRVVDRVTVGSRNHGSRYWLESACPSCELMGEVRCRRSATRFLELRFQPR
jgi:hypothetical protein